MPSMHGTITVPANSLINPFVGLTYEIPTFHANAHFAFNQQSGTFGQVLATLYSGTDLLHEESAIPFQARFPVWPDDFYIDDDVAAYQRLKANLRNTTGAGIVVAFACRLIPI